jgi:hypothetical protein
MPAHKKLLPRPCPQCGLENGGMRWVIFNPRYSNSRDYNDRPYPILRISHYSKEYYGLASKKYKKNRTKIWHNFQMSSLHGIQRGEKRIMLENVFDGAFHSDRTSITIPVSKEWFEDIKKNGWTGLVTRTVQQAHFIKKGDLKKCDVCGNYFKKLSRLDYPKGYGLYIFGVYMPIEYSLLCDECYLKERQIIQDKIKCLKTNS